MSEQFGLRTGEKHPISITGIDAEDIRGTLTNNYTVRALSPLYANYELSPGDSIEVTFSDGSFS